MSIQAAKGLIVELIDEEDATARPDRAYLDPLERVAAEKGYNASTDEIRDSLYSVGGGFEIPGFLR